VGGTDADVMPSGAVATIALPPIAVRPTAARDAVPAPVAALGHHAENAYELARAGDWAAARITVDSLWSAVAMLPEVGDTSVDATHTGPKSLAVATVALDRAVASRDADAAMRAANHLTELGTRIAAPYHPVVPAGVTRLDYLGRELELLGRSPVNGADAGVTETASALRRTWQEVRPQVIGRGGYAEATRFDSLVARVNAARGRASLVRLATSVLDQVDALEHVFTH
jgi:hypothetical protein